jgi:hypothetical protein
LEVVALKCSARKNKIMKMIFGLVTLILIISCSGDLKNNKKDPVFEKWTTVADNSQGHSPSAEPKKINISELTAKQAASDSLAAAS